MKESKKEMATIKAEHGTTYTITVTGRSGSDISMIIKEMDRKLYKAVSPIMAKDEMTGIEMFLKNTRVGGCKLEEITEYFPALRQAGMTILPLLSMEAGELKKN